MFIRDFYTKILQISDPNLIDKILAITELKHLNKGEYFIREGERQTHVYFLLKGILRGYFLDINGKDITDCFGAECGSPAVPCFNLDSISTINIEALENSDVISIPMVQALELMDEYLCLVKIYNQFLQTSLQYHWEIKCAIYQYTAMQRYQWFLHKYPGLITRVKKAHRFFPENNSSDAKPVAKRIKGKSKRKLKMIGENE